MNIIFLYINAPPGRGVDFSQSRPRFLVPVEMSSSWQPPSLPLGDKLKSFTFHHSPPIKEPVILGVDEAGRGPVLGPMVYGVAYCPLSFKTRLAEVGFDDSKVLTAERREELLQQVCESTELAENVGWATTIMTAVDISAGMLKPGIPYNLNEQAHDTTMMLIQRVLDAGIEIAEIYVDTVGPPDKYQRKLAARFPGSKVTVAKKADSLYPIVSCASICAKVTRDYSLNSQLSECGSGYPSDPNTVRWLNQNMDKLFGWGPLVRYSWATAKDMLDKTGISVDWPEEVEGGALNTTKGLPKIGFEYFAV